MAGFRRLLGLVLRSGGRILGGWCWFGGVGVFRWCTGRWRRGSGGGSGSRKLVLSLMSGGLAHR